eukprot:7230927-Pyramimonas_sp.AAC.1
MLPLCLQFFAHPIPPRPCPAPRRPGRRAEVAPSPARAGRRGADGGGGGVFSQLCQTPGEDV